MASATLSPRLSAAPVAEPLFDLPSSIATDLNMSSSSLFDDLVDWPSSPRPSNMVPQSPAPSIAASAVNTPAAAAPTTTDPETLFRHYLTIELRKMGSEPDQSLVDHYVRQHAQSLSRARTAATSPTATTAAQMYPAMDIESTGAQHSALSPPESSTSTTTSPNLIASRSFSLSPVPDEDEAEMASGVSMLSADVDMSPFKVKVEGAIAGATSIDPIMTQLQLDTAQKEQTAQAARMAEDDKSSIAHLGMTQSVTQAQQDANTVILEQLSNAAQEQHSSSSSTTFKPHGAEEDPDEELRTNPEQYAKLTSKEKRQLRNKLSARNFRERRKEYITHLEGQLSDRDTIIEGLRAELANVKGERQSLADEVRSLRAAAASRTVTSGGATITQADVARILDALQRSNAANAQDSAAMSSRPATPSSATFASSSARPNSPRPHLAPSTSTSSFVQANTRKDSFASRMTSSDGSTGKGVGSFWGGAQGSATTPFGGVGSGFMSVHTTLVPPSERALASVFSHLEAVSLKPSSKKASEQGLLDALRGLSISSKKGKMPVKAAEAKQNLSGPSTDSLFDVYDAFASLLRNDAPQKEETSGSNEDDSPPTYSSPPTYEAAVAQPQQQASAPTDMPDDLSDCLMGALERAFATAGTSAPEKGGMTTSSRPVIDAEKIAALLDGRAELRLVDSRTGAPFGAASPSPSRPVRRASTGAAEVAACA